MLLDRLDLSLLERELISYVFERAFGKPWRGENVPKDLFRSFAAHAQKISDSFTLDRRNLDTGYLRSKEGRFAYLLYFHLANVARTCGVLEEMHCTELWPNRPIRVLDVGCGTAPSLWAMALAARTWGGEIAEVIGLDREKSVLSDAAALFDRFGKLEKWNLPKLKTVHADFFDARTPATLKKLGAFDLIFCSNVLNELNKLPAAKLQGMVRSLTSDNLASDGALIVIEPALQSTSRRLAAWRDQWLEKLPIHIPIPCGHSGACPLNREPKDWCHFELHWASPPLRHRLERALEHQSEVLKYSYLLARKGTQKAKANQYRVLSDVLHTPQGDLILLCSPDQKLSLKVDSKKERFKRGDLLHAHLEEIPRGVHRYAKPVGRATGGSKI